MKLPFVLAKRFVAGETFHSAQPKILQINRKNIHVTLDMLGENVTDPENSRENTEHYIKLLQDIHKDEIDSTISVKLTMLGLDIGYDFCKENLFRLLDKAYELNNFVRIDMEGSEYTEQTIQLFKEAMRKYGKHVGIVIQVYLHRSEKDVQELAELGADVRLCKGAYNEPERLALQNMPAIREAFKEYIQVLLEKTPFTRIGTHDDEIIEWTKDYIDRQGIGKAKFEFQMLYGLRQETMEALTREGYNSRIYVPFGTEWLPYFTRRLKERKENIWFILTNLFKK